MKLSNDSLTIVSISGKGYETTASAVLLGTLDHYGSITLRTLERFGALDVQRLLDLHYANKFGR